MAPVAELQLLTADIERLQAEKATMYQELELAADTFRDFSNVLRAIDKDVMSAAAGIAERHIREYLASMVNAKGQSPNLRAASGLSPFSRSGRVERGRDGRGSS